MVEFKGPSFDSDGEETFSSKQGGWKKKTTDNKQQPTKIMSMSLFVSKGYLVTIQGVQSS